MQSLNEKVVFITGGSSGYGKAMASAFTNEGAKVVIAARKEEELKSAMSETGCDAYFVMDVTSASDWDAAVEFVMERYGRIDILINNAGGAIAIDELTNQSVEQVDKCIALNLNGVIYGSRVFAPYMKDQGSGSIINVSSVCAKEAWAGFTVYSAAKWGVLGFSKGLYVELRPFGVRVTCLIPASANTGFLKAIGRTEEQNMLLEPKDVADAALMVCKLPDHAVVEELTVWGIDQEVNPL